MKIFIRIEDGMIILLDHNEKGELLLSKYTDNLNPLIIVEKGLDKINYSDSNIYLDAGKIINEDTIIDEWIENNSTKDTNVMINKVCSNGEYIITLKVTYNI